MEVEFELTPEDVIAAQRYYQKHGRKRNLRDQQSKSMTWVLVMVGGCSLLIAGQAFDYTALDWWLSRLPEVLLGALVTVICVGVILYLRANATLHRSLQKGGANARLLERQKIRIDHEGVHTYSSRGYGVHYCQAIDRIDSIADYTFFFINPKTALILPRRPFPDDHAFNEFVDAARRFRQTARVGEEDRPQPTGIQTFE